MKPSFLVFQNTKGETQRVIPYGGEALELVFRKDTRRLEVVNSLEQLQDDKIPFDTVATIDRRSSPGQIITKGSWGQVRILSEVPQTSPDAPEHKDEKEKPFVLFLKWTAGAEIAALALILALGWWIGRSVTEEPQVVTVFKREEIMKAPIVEMSERKVQAPRVPPHARVSQKSKPKTKNLYGKTNGKSQRTGNDLSRIGALGAFGGMNKSSSGLGGLSQSPSKSSGYGFDGQRARGGSERGLLGKGLVQAGIGSGEKLQGYGGYGDHGKGQGQAAYGVLGMAGRSGGYYLPLSEDATIEGGLDRDQINAVIRRNIGQVTYCYEKGLQVKPGLSGRVAIQFIISPHGDVSTAKVANTSLDASRVESCIVDKLRGWKFPKPRGNVAVRVNYPFMLKRLNQG